MNPNRIIRVASFNLLNLVKANTLYYEKRKYSDESYAKKIEWVAHQLKTMNADIVGFQEVFHEEPLREAIEKSGIYKDYNLVMALPTGDKPTVAFLSRYPVLDYEVIEFFPEGSQLDFEDEDAKEKIIIPFKKFSRPILKIHVQVRKDLDMTVYVTHLKSKRPLFIGKEERDNPLDLAKGQARSLLVRACEATAFRLVLMATLKDREHPVIVMGDVNDTGLAVTTKIISGEAPNRNIPQNIKQRIWDVILYHVQDIQARQSYGDFYYTHIHNGHYESLDHIMVSQELVAQNPRSVGKVLYVSVLNDHLLDQTLTDERIDEWKSDHGQVLAVIELKSENNKQQESNYKEQISDTK